MDNHSSHYSLGLLLAARQINVEIFGYPPHCTHALQGLDIVCFAKMKTTYRKLVRDFELRVQRPAAKQDFLELFGRAYLLSFDSETVQSAFRVTGVYPFDRNAITADQMKPSEETSLEASFPLPLASPVRRVMAAFQLPENSMVNAATHLPHESQGSRDNGTTAHSPDTDQHPSIDPALFTPTKRARALYSTLAQSGSAGFLVAKEKLTSEQSLPPIVIEKTPASIEEPDWEGMQQCLERMTLTDPKFDDVTELAQNIARAQIQSRTQKNIADAAQAQLVLATMHNQRLRTALYEKEKAKSSANARILDDGAPRIWTSDAVIQQVREKQEAKEREEMEMEMRRSEARRKKELNLVMEREWQDAKTHHIAQVARWEAKCATWKEEGLPRQYWDPKPPRPSKHQIRERIWNQLSDAAPDESLEEIDMPDADEEEED